MEERIHLCLAHMSGREMDYIQEAFDRNWVVPLGFNVDAFEDALSAFAGSGQPVLAVASGTAAIHLALICLGVERGDEVICQSFSFAASANPIVYQGATPVFVDSEPDTWNMSPALLEEAIQDRLAKTGRKPRAIIPVHLFGMPARMDAIMEVAARYDIPVVEDAAEALGSRYCGKECGTFGRYGIYSFNGNKMITTSGGGALLCPDEAAKRRALFFATQAREPRPYYHHEHIGHNYRLSNICAGIGRGQMTVLADHLAHHRRTHDLYVELFRDVDGIAVHSNPSPDFESNYWLTTVTIDPALTGTDTDTVRQHLERKNIESRPLWKPLHLQPVFASVPRYVSGVSEHLFGCGLCLPSGPYVGRAEVERVVAEVKSCLC
ncbi:MAG: DegT/DnrJ/EryC1/StrS family aminotransferase [Alloprevotella sp.]|nr:DegT/DnrJ/EryC1/StrS family aminotransferase [Alloprevotella sp.]